MGSTGNNQPRQRSLFLRAQWVNVRIRKLTAGPHFITNSLSFVKRTFSINSDVIAFKCVHRKTRIPDLDLHFKKAYAHTISRDQKETSSPSWSWASNPSTSCSSLLFRCLSVCRTQFAVFKGSGDMLDTSSGRIMSTLSFFGSGFAQCFCFRTLIKYLLDTLIQKIII